MSRPAPAGVESGGCGSGGCGSGVRHRRHRGRPPRAVRGASPPAARRGPAGFPDVPSAAVCTSSSASPNSRSSGPCRVSTNWRPRERDDAHGDDDQAVPDPQVLVAEGVPPPAVPAPRSSPPRGPRRHRGPRRRARPAGTGRVTGDSRPATSTTDASTSTPTAPPRPPEVSHARVERGRDGPAPVPHRVPHRAPTRAPTPTVDRPPSARCRWRAEGGAPPMMSRRRGPARGRLQRRGGGPHTEAVPPPP